MGEILAIVLPVFGLIGLGALFAWTKLLSHASGDALSDFVFVVAIPMLIFRIVATRRLLRTVRLAPVARLLRGIRGQLGGGDHR